MINKNLAKPRGSKIMKFIRKQSIFLILYSIYKSILQIIDNIYYKFVNRNLPKLVFYRSEEKKPNDFFPTVHFDPDPFFAFRRREVDEAYLPHKRITLYCRDFEVQICFRLSSSSRKTELHLELQRNFKELPTDRELECAALALCGFSSKQIGIFLSISFRTVEKNLQLAYEKLECYGRYHCIETMYTKGILTYWQSFAIELMNGKEHLFESSFPSGVRYKSSEIR